MKSQRIPLYLFGIAATVIGLAGCSGAKDAGAPPPADGTPAATNDTSKPAGLVMPDQTPDSSKIQVGLVASINGDLKPWGEDSVKGAVLAVDEFNEANDVGGKKIQLLIEDSASKPEQGKTAAEKLMSKGVLGLLGEVASGITMQMALTAKEKGVPVLAIGATKTDLTTISPDVYRVCYTDDLQGPVMAEFAYNELGLRNVALMTDKKQPYSTYLSETFRNHFAKLGGKIVDEQFYESAQTQFSGQLTQLKAKNPDGLFLSGYFTEVGPIVRQAKDAGINAKFLGGDGWDSSDILTSGGEAILGGFFCNHYNNLEDRPEVKEFLGKWDRKFGGTPGTTMGALAYDATKLMLDSLKRAKEVNAKGLSEAIRETVDFPGVSGKITLKGQNGNPPKRALVVKLTKDGQVFEKAYEPTELTKFN